MAVTQASGGYVITAQPLVRTGHTAHTTALDRPVSQADIDAINTVQATPWRINRFILDVLQEAFVTGHPVLGLDGAVPSLPPRMDDAVWAAMPEADRKAHTDRRRDIHAARATAEGRQQALLDRLEVAQEMRNRERIWFPHTKDFRGRIYPLPVAGPHPQGDDVAKALLMFAEGLRLGDDGLFWLCVRAANCYGHDKLPLEERVAWALDNSNRIATAAEHPLRDAWWTAADDPWSFLATCEELRRAHDNEEGDPADFVSHLPIPMDGSCNGLQHLSAMGLDPVGALATNLCPGPRQDIYEQVAQHVRARVEADAASGRREALSWHGKVTRAVCKRAVMTTPYGVTDSGIRTQLLNDGHVPAEGDDRAPAAGYLKDCLVEALGATIQSGKAIMAWLQTVAHRLAEAGLPFDWTTPTGSRCRQAYFAFVEKRVETLCGRVVLVEEHTDGTIMPRKQALGSAPNYVHSFDAAHLSLTVNAAHEEGINSFAMIHDSFGTHARNTTTLARVLREQFVAIYREDWLRKTYEEVRAAAPHVDIPEPPARGEFDVASVLDAPFFFS